MIVYIKSGACKKANGGYKKTNDQMLYYKMCNVT